LRRGAAADAVVTYQQVLKLFREGRLKTDIVHVELSLGLALAAAGKSAEARRTLLEAADRFRTRDRKGPLPPQDEAMVATMLAAAGRRDEARSLAEGAGRHAKGSIDVSYELARAWAVLGDRGRAIRYLEEAWAAGYSDPYFILIDPPFAAVQDDPAIEKLAPRR
jgi:tetratricopeptide (TPR) repeat protein